MMSQAGANTEELTTREQVMQYLIDFKRAHDGNTPTSSEIAEGCAVSVSVVKYHLTQLLIENRIRILSDRPRKIAVVGGEWRYHGDPVAR